MLIVSGIPVSSGVAIGKAYILAHALTEVEPYTVTEKNITNEIKRFNQANKQLKSELLGLKKGASKEEVLKAANQLQKKIHPDLNRNVDSSRLSQLVNEAKEQIIKSDFS